MKWLESSRFASIRRPYTAKDILPFTSRYPRRSMSIPMSYKLYNQLREHQRNRTASITFGALDPIQAVAMAPYVDTIYCSGWQSSASGSSTDEVGPDFADYSYNTVPDKVNRLVRALDFHDIKYRSQHSSTNYMVPVVADADAGFGGVSSVMKVTKLFIEAGAGGIHLEDQRQGAKRCGHLGSKVLVPVREHIERLIAARLQADIEHCPLVLVSRTDAESATFLDSDGDPRDTRFIIGDLKHPFEISDCTLDEALNKIKPRTEIPSLKGNTIDEATAVLRSVLPSFEWQPRRSSEGYYSLRNGIEPCITRSMAYAPYSDLLWMETSLPNYNQAKQFADTIKAEYPDMMLAYNLSPSFNWDKAGMTNFQIREFSSELAKLGFCWQFITLAGFHLNGLATTLFARRYRSHQMLAYVEDIQRKEREHNVDLLKHQTWSGVEVADQLLTLVTSGRSSTLASTTSTEKQFK